MKLYDFGAFVVLATVIALGGQYNEQQKNNTAFYQKHLDKPACVAYGPVTDPSIKVCGDEV